MKLHSSFSSSLCLLASTGRVWGVSGPFLTQMNESTWVFGNEIWNVTQYQTFATELWYGGRDLVGDAVGHYVSYNGAASNLNWSSATITANTSTYLDIGFSAIEGEMHWVIYPDLAGAYQYFVNRGLPVLGEFRTLWRLDNTTFPKGRTNLKDEELPALSEYDAATKVQDETWERTDGTFITKYDWTAWIREWDFYGVYGEDAGSWYINPGKDYYNGNHLKQELTVHRESSTGDAVQLNVLHGTHFMASSSDVFSDGKIWGPWLWYLNDGSKADAEARKTQEFSSWPYAWFNNTWYQNRAVAVEGSISLSDGRPASGAAVFLGDNNPNKTALDMGGGYYYTTYADADGAFSFEHVLAGTYGLQAWSNGSEIADVSTSLLINDVQIPSANGSVDIGAHVWTLNDRRRLFQLGDFDRKALGFTYGGAPYQHALVEGCPANLTFTIGQSNTSDWCFAQSANGTAEIVFEVDAVLNQTAVLTVSLAGFSAGTIADITLNGAKVGNLSSLASDQSLYRSATAAGEWRLLEFRFAGSLFEKGNNSLAFTVTNSTKWRGWMWDSIILEWA
ncbi:polysaccharide lyase family 4, domain III-domain-containing protein [Phyllosticta citriasiana]|uniref:polysaccharide lyase family 4, domain III-domain-containing protein n=1 Tax=Phyllosticta citriasiana TaxID=595635 RepID=UPI0030FDCA12